MMHRMLIRTLLLFLMISSITQLEADTNTLPLSTPTTTQAADTLAGVRNDLTQDLDNIKGAIGALATIYAPRMAQLDALIMPLFNQLLTHEKNIKSASLADLFRMQTFALEGTTYINRLISSDFDASNEFNPVIQPNPTATETEVHQLHEQTKQQHEILKKKLDESFHDFATNLHNQVRSQLSIIDKALQTINNNVNNNKKLKNKEQIRQDIMDLRAYLRNVQREMISSGTNLAIALEIFKLNKSVLLYLKDMQYHRYTKWKFFDPAAYKPVMRDIKSDMDLHEVFMDIIHTSMQLEKLEKDTEKVDLTWVNRTARAINSYIVSPFERYGLGKYLAAGTCTTLLGLYTTYYFGWSETIANLFGHHISPGTSFDPHNYERLDNYHQSSTEEKTRLRDALRKNLAIMNNDEVPFPLYKLEQFLSDNKMGLLVIGTGLVWLNYKYYTEIWEDAAPALKRKISIWFRKLQGGSIAKQAEKDDIFLPNLTFDDIIGLDYAKSLVYPHLKYIKDPERWDTDEIAPPTGILLTGPTRSGKTHFAKAICGEIKRQNPGKEIAFIPVTPHDIEAKGIHFWLFVAKMSAPCVLFIDEIDLLGLQRTEDKKKLSDFLQALSGLIDKDPKKQVIIIATTNRPENLDNALVQAGRLPLEIRFEYPTIEERKALIMKRLNQLAIDPAVFDIDVDKLARETRGHNFEEIKGMIDGAFIKKGMRNEVISQKILEESMDANIRKIVDIDTKKVSSQEKMLFAAHHAGQIVAHLLLNPDEKIAKVTICKVVTKVKEEAVYFQYYDQPKQKGFEHGMVFTYTDHDTYNAQTHDELIKHAKILLSGKFGEKMITGTQSTFYGWKKNNAFNIVKGLVGDGLDFEKLSDALKESIVLETQKKIVSYEQEVEALLKKYPKTIQALTNALAEKHTLSMQEITEIVNATGELKLT